MADKNQQTRQPDANSSSRGVNQQKDSNLGKDAGMGSQKKDQRDLDVDQQDIGAKGTTSKGLNK